MRLLSSTLAFLLGFMRSADACLGGFGGGGQACCPPHAAPSCGSAPSCYEGGGSYASPPNYGAPPPYSGPPQPVPPPPPNAYASPYQSYAVANALPARGPAPPLPNSPYVQPSTQNGVFPNSAHRPRPGQGAPMGPSNNNYPRIVSPSSGMPGHIPPGVVRSRVTNERTDLVQSEQANNPFLNSEEEENNNVNDKETQTSGNQRQVNGAKKAQESNSAIVEDEVEKPSPARYDEDGFRPGPQPENKENPEVSRYEIEERHQSMEEHSTGYKTKV